MGDTGWGIVFVLGIVAAVAAIAIVIIWQGLSVQRTKLVAETELARDDAYRALARESAAAQQAMADEQHKIARDLADLKERVISIEKMMQEVG